MRKPFSNKEYIHAVELFRKIELPSQPHYEELGASAVEALHTSLSKENYSTEIPPQILLLWKEVQNMA